ncbi:MAG: L-seryl-tRNA(Sec) selenium transferase [Firmicutes bacterium]|nr:L-seryl-tRNA(Sec) selenium transferase [Bacillota bacterium]MBQ6260249.1 L-seryl-tRNA(Sec) selenium transferase [Bacillota bacterium]MBR0114307.1 L-seryl-tRNA(Sec) selenium transferase [Bacillota bacterium]MBR0441629.1 L-seryl-tRNA(Sec) selenium transferase [Bacillota bacterium]
MDKERSAKLKSLPKVDQVLAMPMIAAYSGPAPRETVVDAVRDAIDGMRKAVLGGEDIEVSAQRAAELALAKLTRSEVRSLRRVINGTGVILHTNLGRARLSESATEVISSVAMGYSTLEYDVEEGKRGSRHDHINKLICAITGAEDAIAVNNNAAATLLVLSAICFRTEVLVSRGELVEIGGAFRIPDIMRISGATLKEIGTTNKTHLYDYERHINENTGAILKVHTSNYRITGFTEDVSCRDLVKLAHDNGLPMIYDIGSGLMVDLKGYGLDEPVVPQAIKDGADLVLFSGDKLLGGPQAGIIAGRKCFIDAMKKHPLARVMRLDKMTLAGLEETFRQYRDPAQAMKNIPVLQMITAPSDDIKYKAQRFALKLAQENPLVADFSVVKGIGRVGGGSAPMLNIDTWAVAVSPREITVDEMASKLRHWSVPVICHIQDGLVLLDMRTVTDDELSTLAKAVSDVLR